MRKLDFSIVAFIIAFILGPMTEDALRQTMVLFGNQPSLLLERPIALLFFVLTAFSIWRFSKSRPAILQEPG
jgi:putative tricarboxylic transport membrane protein